jgi:hypothetical protein
METEIEDPQPQMGLTFEMVWAAIVATNREIKAMSQAADKRHEETERVLKQLGEHVGGVKNSLGDMAEGLMATDLYEHFAAQGLNFDSSFQNYILKGRRNPTTKKREPLAEVDMLLINGTIAMAVEAKTTMTRGDVDKHVKRIEILRRVPNSLFANRALYGAMAAVKTSRKAQEYALQKGFYVIELTGDTVKLTVPQGFTPKTW